MNIIVDYGLGNLGSVIRGFNRAGIDTKLSRDLEEIKNADSLILPGVGAFGDAMNKLNELELVDTIKDFAKTGKYMIGICLGMQIMYEQGIRIWNSQRTRSYRGLCRFFRYKI